MKAILKQLANLIFTILVLPGFLLYWLSSLPLGRDRAFPGWSQFWSLFPGIVGVYLRRAFYRLTLSRCTGDCWIGFGCIFSHATAEVGHNVYVGPYCCLGGITLEDDVLLGSHVSITNGSATHGIEKLDVPIREQPGEWIQVTIGKDTWIGDRAVILADVGAHCVIGAGSVVTKPIPDYAIAVGSPAKVIRYRNEQANGGCGPTVEGDQ